MKTGADITWRVHLSMWEKEEAFVKFLKLCGETGLKGKIAFFTADSHVPPDLEILFARIAVLKKRIDSMRRLGFSAGINSLCTLGHLDEDLGRCAKTGQKYTGLDGTVSRGCFCPNDPLWRESYLAPCYTALAETRPDFIYSDDDIRLSGHGVMNRGCFCPVCMEGLSRFLGFRGTREELADFFEDPLEGDARKRKMLAWNRRTLASLHAFIEKTVHRVDPSIALGVMDGFKGWEGHGYRENFDALKGSRGAPVLWRPGGGFYTDGQPDGMLLKANLIAAESAMIPREAAAVEAEIENYNYQRLNKSESSAALESALYCAVGATGCAYNVFCPFSDDAPETGYSLVRTLLAQQPLLDRIVSCAGRSIPRGVWNGNGRDMFLQHNRNCGGKWLEKTIKWPGSFLNSDLQKIGIPPAFSPEGADLCAVGGNTVWSMTDGMIETMLSVGGYFDAEALQALNERGFASETGFTLAGSAGEDAVERYTEHPLNAPVSGMTRSGRQSFWPDRSAVLKPAPKAEILSEYFSIAGNRLGGCASGLYENSLGGRIMVCGYYPWKMYFYCSAAQRIKRIFAYLSRGTLRGYAASFHKAAVFIRGENAAVLNMSADSAEKFVLRLKTEKAFLKLFDKHGKCTVSNGTPAERDCLDFEFPVIPPWSLLFGTLSENAT